MCLFMPQLGFVLKNRCGPGKRITWRPRQRSASWLAQKILWEEIDGQRKRGGYQRNKLNGKNGRYHICIQNGSPTIAEIQYDVLVQEGVCLVLHAIVRTFQPCADYLLQQHRWRPSSLY